MKKIAAGKFKDQCLRILDQVRETREPIVVTKRGEPVAQVVPYSETSGKKKSLAKSILREKGDPFSTGEKWDADLS